ncbi:adenosylcobinamide-GDP ribazoletransferase [Chelatococcus reniformis]|uniref:Adenosylcobinamide-GDP ribazoletransferase n=1 Tax=Chelatococcus reniformis TaxID=1494448 RepID=A0A916XM58_9HYPH|nr:adenosylcobinamide-GDP ribazoletransferase [Chelatococcus reniformis]GGC86075.1 adenosylcobinamide-GDP ribazoletransferase [Chelatococcus reniformis]
MRALADARLCLGFFTRLPAGAPAGRPLADAIWAAPIAGGAVALLSGFALLAAHAAGAPPTVAAALALGAGVLATGALHEDGLADVADGFGGGTTAARKLEIMRDSRIGTYGVVALALTLLLRWSALASVLANDGPGVAVLALLAAHAASRSLLPAMMRVLPRARGDGLSVRAGSPGAGTAALALLLGAAALLPLGLATSLIAAGLLVGWTSVLAWLALRHIGGQTGDVLGALQQGAEVAVLCAASLV